MLGESVETLHLSERGADHDRLFALTERATGRYVSARQYPGLVAYRARLVGEAIEIICPDGRTMAPEDPELLAALSNELGRKLELSVAFDERHPSGLFDDSSILLASVQSLASLAAAHPAGKFDKRRFRANIWVDVPGETGFPEELWIQNELLIGDEVRLRVERPCERCVITTTAQEDLETDYSILKTIVQNNNAILGVYCSITRGGTIRLRDHLRIL